MRNRGFNFRTREVLWPALVTLALGVAILFALTPGLGAGRSTDPGLMRIYSSVPMEAFNSIVHGIEMALEEAGREAGGFRLDYRPLNGARLQPNGSFKWDAALELANARAAAADPDAMVYIGTYNSGAAKISIPVLNRVNMAMISPGNTYPGLTKPGTGTAGEPWVYYPLGLRNYFRVLTADDLQGAAAAAYAKEIGAGSVYILDDTELYGKGIATIVGRSAQELGLSVVGGPESIDVRTRNYASLAAKIVGANPDLVYFGGVTANNPGLVLAALRNAGYSGVFMGADGIIGEDFSEQVREGGGDIPDASGQIFGTLPGLPAAKLTGPGADWYQRYKSRFPNDDNEDFAPFGYEAARVAISAINRAQAKDREKIRAAVAQTTSADLAGEPILGDWRFDPNGDTSLITISVQRLGDRWDYEGVMQYNSETKRWQFQGE